ncbi:MAG: ArsA family ATPase [Myxococcales bacterium]|nr:ArsA family ATPase [Myxococcales bacterium]MCB9542581.1 ArsA family ATPase [Myxococcales bacterium]
MPDPKTPPPPEPALLDRRFVLVTGKGGVGKSTVTALLALLSARAGKRTLVCELDTHEQVAPMLGHAPVGGRVTRLEDNLSVVNIDPSSAMEEYGLMKLRFRALYRVVFDNPLVQSLVRFVPGMNDLLMLGKAFNHEREVDEQGAPVYDRVIIDAPATGHGITFFKLPRIIRDAVPAGNMHREAADMWALLTDPRRTAVHLVALPEELPVQETRELRRRLANELGVPLGYLVVNMLPEPPLDPTQAEDFARLAAAPRDDRLARLADATRIAAGRAAIAATHAAALHGMGLPVVDLPQHPDRRLDRADLEALADRFARAIGAEALVAGPPA